MMTQPRQSIESDSTALTATDITKRYRARIPFTKSVEVLTDASVHVYPVEVVGIVFQRRSHPHNASERAATTLPTDCPSTEDISTEEYQND